jgi:hypothetical protein
MREVLAGALFKKAVVLGELGRQDDADAAFTELITRLEDDESPSIQHIVSAARENRELLLDDDAD